MSSLKTPSLPVAAPAYKDLQLSLFEGELERPAFETQGYKGLGAFHKYWGKKPVEYASELIELLSQPGDVVADPFLGSGFIARTALGQGRRFLGCDLNPLAVELARLSVVPPDVNALKNAFETVRALAQSSIEATYRDEIGGVATHYLWDKAELLSVWRVAGRHRGEREPRAADLSQFQGFESFEPKRLRPLRLFDNSRINSAEKLEWNDLFTGRALHNIELLLNAIDEACAQQPLTVRRALRLGLTAGAGQMSRMVFAITGRGKNSASYDPDKPARVEVGSWVIGYWRPPLHFEINVWNCFERRVTELIKALCALPRLDCASSANAALAVAQGVAPVGIEQDDARRVLKTLPAHSVDLIITDPPHSDRIPYLEMSEMWNAMLGYQADFGEEIVVSNAKTRGKNKEGFAADLNATLRECQRVLHPDGWMVIEFNARDAQSWEALRTLQNDLPFRGQFALNYSARSVVQDSRKGSLKSDIALLWSQNGCRETLETLEARFPDLKTDFPMVPQK